MLCTCGRPKMTSSVLEGLRDRKLGDIQLDSAIAFLKRVLRDKSPQLRLRDKISRVSSA